MKIIDPLTVYWAKHKALFDLIQNKEHWKMAIDAFIPYKMFQEFSDAACYFHGRELTARESSEDGKYIRVTSAGYACW